MKRASASSRGEQIRPPPTGGVYRGRGPRPAEESTRSPDNACQTRDVRCARVARPRHGMGPPRATARPVSMSRSRHSLQDLERT